MSSINYGIPKDRVYYQKWQMITGKSMTNEK